MGLDKIDTCSKILHGWDLHEYKTIKNKPLKKGGKCVNSSLLGRLQQIALQLVLSNSIQESKTRGKTDICPCPLQRTSYRVAFSTGSSLLPYPHPNCRLQ
jgi:hypothetical protein